jgi:hypothetical protein
VNTIDTICIGSNTFILPVPISIFICFFSQANSRSYLTFKFVQYLSAPDILFMLHCTMQRKLSCTVLIYLFLAHTISFAYGRPLLILTEDSRGIIPIASFGFLAGGELKLEVSDFKVSVELRPKQARLTKASFIDWKNSRSM